MITMSIDKTEVSISCACDSELDIMAELSMGVITAINEVAGRMNADPFDILKAFSASCLMTMKFMEDDKDERE